VRDRDAALRVLAFRAGARFAVAFLAVDFFAVDFFFAVERLAVAFLAVDFLAVDFFAAVFRAGALLAVAFLAVDFFAVDFFLAVAFLAVALFAVDFFLAVAFLAVDFRADPERELELFVELRLEERDVERAAAGTARAISAGASSISSVTSTMVDSPPHVSSAPTVGSLHEPAVDVSDASPVPLQSSSVM
jgi:hypothetical protein